MISLNLLPQKEKIFYKFAKIERLVNYYSAVILVFAFFFIISLLLIKYFLIWKINIVASEIGLREKSKTAEQIKDFQQKIDDANNLLRKIDILSRNYFNFSKELDFLSGLSPKSIRWTNLSFEKESGKFAVSGISSTREDFLLFLDRLEKSEHFKNINSPLSNVVKKENFDFRITFELK